GRASRVRTATTPSWRWPERASTPRSPPRAYPTESLGSPASRSPRLPVCSSSNAVCSKTGRLAFMADEHRCTHGAGAGRFAIEPTPEIEFDRSLRRLHLVLPGTLLAAALLYAGVVGCAVLYEHEVVLAIVPAALFVHAFAIVLVHDGAHRSITHTRADPFLANVGAGLILLPFYAEPFRTAHLVHHRHTNCRHDPL